MTRQPAIGTTVGMPSLDQFMRAQWQQRPHLLRGFMPLVTPPLSPQQLCALATRDDVISRIVVRHGPRSWSVEHGPFDAGFERALARAYDAARNRLLDRVHDRIRNTLATAVATAQDGDAPATSATPPAKAA